MKNEDARKALEWIADHYAASSPWINDVARAALKGDDVDAAIKKGEKDIQDYLRPKGPSTLDGGYSAMASGWGDGRGR